MDVTRWRADTTRDDYGSFVYLRDTDSGELWSNLYHPMDKEPDRYSVHFPLDRAEYRRRDNGIETRTELIVSPEDDVEIRRITINKSFHSGRRIQATSYYELAMALLAPIASILPLISCSSRQNPFLVSGALLAYRSSRQEDDPPILCSSLPGCGWSIQIPRNTPI